MHRHGFQLLDDGKFTYQHLNLQINEMPGGVHQTCSFSLLHMDTTLIHESVFNAILHGPFVIVFVYKLTRPLWLLYVCRFLILEAYSSSMVQLSTNLLESNFPYRIGGGAFPNFNPACVALALTFGVYRIYLCTNFDAIYSLVCVLLWNSMSGTSGGTQVKGS